MTASQERNTLTNGVVRKGSDGQNEDQREIQLSHQKKEKNMAKVLVCIVILFLICQSLKIIPDIYEAVVCRGKPTECKSNFVMDIIISVSHLCLAINSAANFVIYILRGDRFRVILTKLLCKCQWTKASRRSPASISRRYQMASLRCSRAQSVRVSIEMTPARKVNSINLNSHDTIDEV